MRAFIMNLQAIWVANITGFLLIVFLYFSRFITKTKGDTKENSFTVMMWLTMIACIIEPITFSIDGIHDQVCYWINMLGNTYLYYANGLGSFLWMMYVDLNLFKDYSRMKSVYYKISIPVSLLLISLIANLKFHYYFYVDGNYVYHRQPTIFIFYIYIMLCAIYSIGLYFYHKIKYGKIAFFPIYMYLIPIVTGSILQMIFYGISTAWLGTAIGIVALHMSLQQQQSYVDSLTGLYNRLYLEHVMFKVSQNNNMCYYGMMIDMNNFKQINDTYGHSAGDQALIDAARIFNSTINSNSTAFRYAGDEFIIILKSKNAAEVENLVTLLRDNAEAFNKENSRPYDISFAIGYDRYYPEIDNTDSFFKKIDKAMYEDKLRCHGDGC